MLADSGFEVVRGLLSQGEQLTRAVDRISDTLAGDRRLLDLPWCFQLGERVRTDARLVALLPSNAVAVQCTLFAKTPTKNWLVALHQDLTIPVACKVESSAYTAWSEKQRRVFVQPPLPVLEQLAAVRVHLDDCDSDNGALRVVPSFCMPRRKP
jgi:Phytanoyl-CoA dioxygenase (PhyH)